MKNIEKVAQVAIEMTLEGGMLIEEWGLAG